MQSRMWYLKSLVFKDILCGEKKYQELRFWQMVFFKVFWGEKLVQGDWRFGRGIGIRGREYVIWKYEQVVLGIFIKVVLLYGKIDQDQRGWYYEC